jgi:folate-dependent phosphoribosylglycinamide formyltransferase PurN
MLPILWPRALGDGGARRGRGGTTNVTDMRPAPSFLIVTTGDLPEAYFVAAFLLARRHATALLNLRTRSARDKLLVLQRLRRRRGLTYVADFVAGRALRRLIVPAAEPFPEIDAAAVADVRERATCMDCNDLHGAAALDFVHGFQPDYLVLAGAPVVRPALLGLARRGAVNRHLGLAPRFRGSDCPLWALALGQPEAVGYTIHFVTERVDAGDILVQQQVRPDRAESLGAFFARVQRTASEAFVGVLEAIASRRPLSRIPQHGDGHHFPPAGLTTLRRAARVYRQAVRSAVAGAAPAPERPELPRAEQG